METKQESSDATHPAPGSERLAPPNDPLVGDTSATNSDTEKGAEVPLAAAPPPRNVSGAKWLIVVLAILSSIFLFALDNTVVADVQPQIVLQFDSVEKIAWLSVVFVMVPVATNLMFGQLFSTLLPKWLYIAGVLVFEIGSALCGAAPNMDSLIVGRALCGIGGIAMYLGTITLLSLTTTIQERPAYLGSTGLMWGLGTILGPIVGGAFADSSATWRWAFYINLPIGGIFAPVYFFLLPSPDPRPGFSLKARLAEVDWLGAVLMAGAVLSFVMGLNFGGTMYAWSSGQEIALFVVAGVLFLVFGLQQAFVIGTTKERRLFPVDLITDRKSARTVLIMFCTTAAGGAGIFVPVYFIPLLFQFTRGDSAIEAAVRLLPLICFLVFVTLLQGGLLSLPSGKFGLYMPWFTVGGALAVAGGVMMFLVDTTTSEGYIYGASVLLGTGVGTFTQSGFAIAQASVDESKASVVAAFMVLGQTSGIVLALAIGNSVFINGAQNKLIAILGDGITQEQVRGAIVGVGGDFVNSLPPDVQAKVMEAIVESISRPYILSITGGALVLVLSLLMKRERLFMSAAGAGA